MLDDMIADMESNKKLCPSVSALSPGNVNKQKFLTGKNVLLEKDLLQKAAGLKRFECSPLGTSAAKKQHHKLYNVFKFNNKEEKLKKVVLSQIYSTVKILLFKNTTALKNLLNVHCVKSKNFYWSLSI